MHILYSYDSNMDVNLITNDTDLGWLIQGNPMAVFGLLLSVENQFGFKYNGVKDINMFKTVGELCNYIK